MIDEILEQAEGDVLEALTDPEDFDMRRDDPEKVVVDPEPSRMETGIFDLANSTAKVRYSEQSYRENYTCFKENPEDELAFVKSDAVHDYGGTKTASSIYYVVNGEELYRITEDGIKKANAQSRPLEVAGEFKDMYRKALESEDVEESRGEEKPVNYSREPVPPPEDEVFSN